MTNDRKSSKRKFKFVEGKESYFVYLALVAVYIILVGMMAAFCFSKISQVKLEMKFDSEKSFNSVYIALTENPSKVKQTMEEEKVLGIAIYSATGRPFQLVGDAPETLPLEKLSKAKKSGDDSTLGMFVFDASNGTIEYFRLSRFNVAMELGTFGINSGPRTSDIAEIVYIKFQNSQFYVRIYRAVVFTVASVVLITGLILLTFSIYRTNRQYRISMAKNENLIHIGEAARTLAHEIKNPLSALTIQSAVLRKTLPDEFLPDLDVMDHELIRLSNLTNRVSEFLRNPVGNPVLIEIKTFISDLVGYFTYSIKTDFKTNEDLFVMFDPDRARSVFENLIKNAIESCHDRDPEVEVVLKTRKTCVVIQVLDRGDGIPKENKEKLFNPFFTTKIYGSGIGLAISQQFVKAQGGTLKITDREGGGTCVEVSLPMADKEVTNENSNS